MASTVMIPRMIETPEERMRRQGTLSPRTCPRASWNPAKRYNIRVSFLISGAAVTPENLWRFLPLGYLLSIAIETPILLLFLSSRHPWRRRLFAGIWLTACTYPIVVLVMYPLLRQNNTAYLIVAETFAPAAECALFWLAFGDPDEWGRRSMWRDFAAITVANLASFGVGELFSALGWWDWLLAP